MIDAQGRSPDERVLVLAPTRRDTELTGTILGEAGISCVRCGSLEELCRELAGGAGVALITEESLASDQAACLFEAMARQPAWSELPILVLTKGGADSPVVAHAMERLGTVVLLERPLRVMTLVSAVRTALGARQRQYQIRDHLAAQQQAEQRLQRFNETLEQRVAERTALAEQQAEQLRELASALTLTEQRERRRLAQLLHDHLQQLLVAARMNVSALRGRVGDAGHRAALEQIGRLIDESVEASRSLTVELSPPILYESGLDGALAWLGRWMQEKHGLHVEIVSDSPVEGIPEEVRLLLFEAVRELLFNIVKHAGVDAARVETTVPDDRIQVVVSDRGAGFDPQSTDEEGLSRKGFGLFSVAQRLELLGGGLRIDSTPGSGTRVTVHAPYGRRTDQPEGGNGELVEKTGPSHAARGLPKGRPIRVLLADDHQIMRQGLAGLLEDEPDIEVVAEASDGMMAVEMTRETQPDVVVIDLNMPRLDGLEATKRILAEFPQVRVIGLSMHDAHDRADAMREAGAATYLTKGGPSEDLVAAIRGHHDPAAASPQ